MCYVVQDLIYIILRSPPYLAPELNYLIKAGSLLFHRNAGCFPWLFQLAMFGISVSLHQRCLVTSRLSMVLGHNGNGKMIEKSADGMKVWKNCSILGLNIYFQLQDYIGTL